MEFLKRLKEAFKLTPALSELRLFSPLVFGIERFFFLLQFLSPANLLFYSRMEAQNKAERDAEKKELAINRGFHIDLYILAWLLILIICGIIAYKSVNDILSCLCVIFPMFRVFDIMQLTINMTLFDHLRIKRQHVVSGITRTIVLTLWNFLELIFSFGIIYSVFIDSICKASSPIDAYYFSAITQLTIGYGDVYPIGLVKFIAPVQGILGFIFTILVITRFVSLMPRIAAVQSGDCDYSEKVDD